MVKIKVIGSKDPYKWYNSAIGKIIMADKLDSSGNAIFYSKSISTVVEKLIDKDDFAEVFKISFTKDFCIESDYSGLMIKIDTETVHDAWENKKNKKGFFDVLVDGVTLLGISEKSFNRIKPESTKKRIRIKTNSESPLLLQELNGKEVEAEIMGDKSAHFALGNSGYILDPENFIIVNERAKVENPNLNFLFNPRESFWAEPFLKSNPRYSKTISMEKFLHDFRKSNPDAKVLVWGCDVANGVDETTVSMFRGFPPCQMFANKIDRKDGESILDAINRMKTPILKPLTKATKKRISEILDLTRDESFKSYLSEGRNIGADSVKNDGQNYVYRGDFSIERNYCKNDVVILNGKYYKCLGGKNWQKIGNKDFSPKPPLGVVPIDFYFNRVIRKRIEQLKKAIGRYKYDPNGAGFIDKWKIEISVLTKRLEELNDGK